MICSPYGRQWKYPKIYHIGAYYITVNTAYHNVPEIGELIYEKEVVVEMNVKDNSFYSYVDYHVSTDEEGTNGRW